MYKCDNREIHVMNDTEKRIKKRLFIPHCGHMTYTYIEKLTNISAPIKLVIGTTKTKYVSSTLRSKVLKQLVQLQFVVSNVVDVIRPI